MRPDNPLPLPDSTTVDAVGEDDQIDHRDWLLGEGLSLRHTNFLSPLGRAPPEDRQTRLGVFGLQRPEES